jgi:hypothetical protein
VTRKIVGGLLYCVSHGESVAAGSCKRRRGRRGRWNRRNQMNLQMLGGGHGMAMGDFLRETNVSYVSAKVVFFVQAMASNEGNVGSRFEPGLSRLE